MTQATRNLANLTERLMREIENAGPVRHYGVNTDFVSFTKQGLGGLMLTDDDAQQYRKCVNEVHKEAAGKNEQISRSAVESIIQQAMLKALDPEHTSNEKDPSKRLAAALATMEKELREKPVTWEIYFPVDGLLTDNLPYKFGRCTFYLADDAFMGSLEERLRKSFGSDTDTSRVQKIIAGKTGVVTSEDAVDKDAAEMLARNRIRRTLDVLSFFSNLGGTPRSQIIFAEDAGPKRLNPFVFCERKTEGWMPSEWVGPIAPFSFNATFLDQAGQAEASAILQADEPTEFQGRIISALQWAGRASVEPRNEEAFLLFAIALESLLMAREDKSELTEKLALRAAHVIAIPKGRLRVYREVKRLYAIRSQIVHSGHAEVGEADLSLVRFYVRVALLTMLRNSKFAGMASDSDLMDWFRAKLLDIEPEHASPSVKNEL